MMLSYKALFLCEAFLFAPFLFQKIIQWQVPALFKHMLGPFTFTFTFESEEFEKI